MDDSSAAAKMQKAMRTLSVTNFIAAIVFFASYAIIGNWLYLLAGGCVFTAGIGIILFSRFLKRKYFADTN